ncbi:MAG: hypothetical protein U5R31_09360 [Acidimicrobiia bacterium]|nr:hypothetical protein [Acidimicrobiia bacterium]
MRGIIGYAGYVPHNRLQRQAISDFLGGPPRPGTRSVASYDEDTTTMGFEAARLALRPLGPDIPIDRLSFSTADPAYLDKTNATAIHAALRLDSNVLASDAGGAIRSAMGSLRAALDGNDSTLVVAADIRTGLARRAPTRAKAATGPRRCSSAAATTPPCSPSTSAARRPPRSSSTGGVIPVTSARRPGRSASARPSTCRSASRRGTRR